MRQDVVISVENDVDPSIIEMDDYIKLTDEMFISENGDRILLETRSRSSFTVDFSTSDIYIDLSYKNISQDERKVHIINIDKGKVNKIYLNGELKFER